MRVGVLRGGNTFHYDRSLKIGAQALKHLSDHSAQDIFVDKKGVWHMHGAPVMPHEIAQRVDVIFNTLGSFDTLVDYHNIPHTGSDPLTSAIINNRNLLKRALKTHGFKTPFHKEVQPGADVLAIFRSFPIPAVVKFYTKPDIIIVKNIEDLERALKVDEPVLLEEFIPGVKVSVNVIEGYRDQDIYILPPVEIHEKKTVVPSNFVHRIKEELMHLAKKAHELLSLKHYSQADFIVHPKRGIYLIRVSTLPDITEDSALAQSLESVGGNTTHFVNHLLARVSK